MDAKFQNQHYVSQVLQRQWTDETGHLQRYNIKWNNWGRKSPSQVFSRDGYTQLLRYGEIDNSLEELLKQQEDKVPETLAALEGAANNGATTDLGEEIFTNLLWYCSYLWSTSPFAKAVAPLEFVAQLDLDLQHGRHDILKLLGIHEYDIQRIQYLHTKGIKFIIQAKDYLQVIYRIRFKIKCEDTIQTLRHFHNWTVHHSPVELPLSDMAFFKYHHHASNSMLAYLPLSPHLILIGTAKLGNNFVRSDSTAVAFNKLSKEEAEHIRNVICLSGITALAFKARIKDVSECRKRATESGIYSTKIKDLDAVLTAGEKNFSGDLMIMPTTNERFIEFQKSFIEQ